MTEQDFLLRNGEFLTGLHYQVDQIRQGRRTPEAFYRLGRAMEGYRDFIADYLDGLPTTEDRSAVEDRLSPVVHALVERVEGLTGQAVKEGILLANGQIRYDLGMLGISLTFVSGSTKFMI